MPPVGFEPTIPAAIEVARLSGHLSQSTCSEMMHPKTDEHVKPNVELHHLVGNKLK
jgi:hypothetical protein